MIPLNPNEIHIWSTDLTIPSDQVLTEKLAILSKDEHERAMRFKFEIHKKRYIAARYTLRKILSEYLDLPPKQFDFAYTHYNKPYLIHPSPCRIQFNMAHSQDIAIYALALDQAVGVDIEQMTTDFNQDLAKRFFHPLENDALMQLPEEERNDICYKIWARKEAVIKGVGKGLSLPLTSFAVAITDTYEKIKLENDIWYLLPLTVQPGYQAALASHQPMRSISYWSMFNHEKKLEHTQELEAFFDQ